MDNDKKDNNNEISLVNKIEQAQKELPNLILPNMGIIDIDNKIDIDGHDYVKHKSVKED